MDAVSRGRLIELDHGQQAAISTPGNVIVRAGAGSGKTEVLSRRYVALVAGDIGDRVRLSPLSIAAITFTEKAALDMRERIGAVLAARIEAERDESCRRHLLDARRTLALSRISTIHAFCAGILRENPIAAGLDPDFDVLDEYESSVLFEKVCRRTLVEAVREGDPGAAFLVRSRRLTSDTPREDALQILQRMHVEGRRAGYPTDSITVQTDLYSSRCAAEDRTRTCATELAKLVDRLLREHRDTSATATLPKLWPELREQVLAFDAKSGPRAIECLRRLRESLPSARGTRSTPVKEIRTLLDSSPSKFGLSGRLVEAWGELRAAVRAPTVARLIARVGANFEQARRAANVLTFDDLIVAVRDMLRANPEIAAGYHSALRALLIDEYQDTDRVQDQIVTLLTTPTASGAAVPELFLVGDEKQSIYRFRGADVRVFRLHRTLQMREVTLRGNRRSSANILNFINGLAAVAMRANGAIGADYRVEWHSRHQLEPVRETTLDYPVEVIVEIANQRQSSAPGQVGPKPKVSDKRRLEARAIANRIAALNLAGEPIADPQSGAIRPVRYGDVAVLFRAFTDIYFYEEAFSAAGIPCYTIKGRGFYRRREVIDLIALMAAVDDPHDSLNLAAALRSPFFALSDDCLLELGLRLHGARPKIGSIAEFFAGPAPDFGWLSIERVQAEKAWCILHELRVMRGRNALFEIVERALELTDYESVMAGLPQGDQRIANLRKLAAMAHGFDGHGFFTLRDFVRYLERLVEQEPYEPQAQILGENQNVVRLMTIHQAKGLEFPVVVLADAGRKPNYEHRAPMLDPEKGLLLRDTYGSGYDEIPNPALDGCHRRIRDEEDAESVRILYVAITRARDRLIVSEGGSKEGWSQYLREFVGQENWTRLARSGRPSIALECNQAKIQLCEPDLTEPRATAADRPAGPDEMTTAILESRLNFAPEPAGDLTISPTALADFERCPRQYWLRHVMELPERGSGQPYGNSDALSLGLVAHAVLQRVAFGADLQQRSTRIADLTARFGAAAGLAREQCAAIARDLERYAAPSGETLIGREVPFMLNVGPSFFLRGQIDVIARAGETIFVRDYKYSGTAEAGRYQVQMECYALAAARAYPGCGVVAQMVALRERPETIAVALPPLEEIQARLAAIGARMAQAAHINQYPKKPPDKASCLTLGCGYVARCWAD